MEHRLRALSPPGSQVYRGGNPGFKRIAKHDYDSPRTDSTNPEVLRVWGTKERKQALPALDGRPKTGRKPLPAVIFLFLIKLIERQIVLYYNKFNILIVLYTNYYY